ncbi:MAG: flagellar basal body rod protein FlgC [Candidatus Marinarcus sp.]|uniref:flagellar basal body rod protein FlgC n=1 Tax=Candidatus Marinarcus sp. TaxID=3100987 RepID=UPI003B008259
MSLFDGYDIATSGMGAQRTRINVVSANIANAQTTHTAEGGPYKKQNVIFEEILLNQQQKNNSNSDKGLNNQQNISQKPLSSVGIKEIVDAKNEPVMKYEPEHPDANEDGYVAYPNINPVIEMVDLIEAMRSYEANVSAFTTQKTMDTQTIDILKG